MSSLVTTSSVLLSCLKTLKKAYLIVVFFIQLYGFVGHIAHTPRSPGLDGKPAIGRPRVVLQPQNQS